MGGGRETAMVSLFGLVGVPNEGALVLSVLVGLVGIIASLPGGLLWLLNREDKNEIEGQNLEQDFRIQKSL